MSTGARTILLVEGKDDLHIFSHLLDHYAIPEHVVIKEKGGITKLLDSLDVEIDASDLEQLGIVVDADTNIADRWRSLQNKLRESGYFKVPPSPDPTGTIIQQSGRPTIGVWLMPDNTLTGMIEHFARFLVPSGDVLWPKVEQCLSSVDEKERRFPTQHLIKAELHTWLAWQEDPGTPMGLAIKKRYLDAEAPHAQQLIAWIQRLFAL